MTWAAKRKLFYSAIVVAVCLFFLYLAFQNVITRKPTCSDNRKNGDEVGVDCGGGCSNYCKDTLVPPKTRWTRAFPVTAGFTHAVAYVEHQNPNAALREMTYEFSLFDERNELITTRVGKTFLGSLGRTAIIEPLIQVGDRTPVVTRFTITNTGFWEKLPEGTSNIQVRTDQTSLDESGLNLTKLSAVLQNQSSADISNIQVVAILYDSKDNALTASKTELPALPAFEKRTVYFTWPFDISEPVARIEIIPRIDPFRDITVK